MNIDEIRAAKKELKLTTSQLAYLAEVPLGTVSKIMTGETKNPSFVTVEKISLVLEKELQRYRLQKYSEAIREYIVAHPDEEFDPDEFEKVYRKQHHLSDAPIPFAVPLGEEEYSEGNLALNKYRGVSVSEFMKMDEDRGTELFRGRIVRNEAPTISHQRIVRTIGQAIQNYIDAHNGPCEVFNVGVNVRPDMDDDTVFVPDVVTVCDKSIIGEHMIEGAPDWVIEVVSTSSRKRDYRDKLYIYMQAGVREYWICDPDRNMVTTYIQGEPLMAYIYSFKDEIPVGIYNGELKITIN